MCCLGGNLLLGRLSAVAQDAGGGSSFTGLWQERVQALLRERMMNGDEGSQSTSVVSQGSTALLLGSQPDPGAALLPFSWPWFSLAWDHVGLQRPVAAHFFSALFSQNNPLVLFLSRSLHTPG